MNYIEELIQRLDKCEGLVVDVRDLVHIMKATPVESPGMLKELEEFEQFDDRAYRRNSIHKGRNYEILLLCWRTGQFSIPHDHGKSNCAVTVFKGEMTEIRFADQGGGSIEPRSTRILHPFQSVISAGDYIHQIANLQDNASDAVTLHIYSPFLPDTNTV